MHSDWLLLAENVPAAHCRGATDPVTQNEPEGHASHSSGRVRLGRAEYLPRGQGRFALEPNGQK